MEGVSYQNTANLILITKTLSSVQTRRVYTYASLICAIKYLNSQTCSDIKSKVFQNSLVESIDIDVAAAIFRVYEKTGGGSYYI